MPSSIWRCRRIVDTIAGACPVGPVVHKPSNHDAVILSLHFQAGKHHETMLDASIEAGVKRLVPSICGGRHAKAAQDIFPFAKSKAAIMSCIEQRAAERDWRG
jgi:hypothetical protein